MVYSIDCPKCHRKLRVADEHLGKKARCPCGAIFVATAPADSTSAINPPAMTSPPVPAATEVTAAGPVAAPPAQMQPRAIPTPPPLPGRLPNVPPAKPSPSDWEPVAADNISTIDDTADAILPPSSDALAGGPPAYRESAEGALVSAD